jgi:hypothetical protein
MEDTQSYFLKIESCTVVEGTSQLGSYVKGSEQGACMVMYTTLFRTLCKGILRLEPCVKG